MNDTAGWPGPAPEAPVPTPQADAAQPPQAAGAQPPQAAAPQQPPAPSAAPQQPAQPPAAAPPAGPAEPPAGPAYVDTSTGKRDGLDKCPRCGATEISLRAQTGMLTCHFCRHQWHEANIEEAFGLDSPIGELRGRVIGTGARAITEDAEDVLTLKCGACGAEVIVNTGEAMQSRCHWCRNTLSATEQLPNGAVPDGVLPFSVTREQAIENISKFVKSRKFFAHPAFVRQFEPSEVVGVYLPYLIVDANAHAELSGQAEIETGRRTVSRGSDDDSVTVYDADVYNMSRSFELHVDDLVLESSAERADMTMFRNTNNVINAIQPFDTAATVAYNANYLRGFTSEKRNLDIDAIVPRAADAAMSIARVRASETTKKYDRGVRWDSETLTVHGTRWVSVYLPVWLYSYYQPRGEAGQGLVHYVAVNGRTGETMGSVPIRQGRLIGISVAIGVVGTILGAIAGIFA
ncbi:TFIIB-type zinc ribbon-containing protein [Leucobacter sp. HY1910]